MATAIVNPNRLGNTTHRADISRAMEATAKEVFMKTLEKTKPQYQDIITKVSSDKKIETYDSVGNLKSAEIKKEGAAIKYGEIGQAYETKLENNTITNGFSVTWEAVQDDKWGVIVKAKSEELARTMLAFKEKACAKVWTDSLTATGADGVPYASHAHPLLNGTGTNDNLVEGEFNTDNYIKATKLFNHWKNHAGDHFDTTPTTIIAHRDRQVQLSAMFESQLRAFENSNTKNTIPPLKMVFNTYIDENAVFLVDDSIKSAILQERSALQNSAEWDNTGTLNWYYATFERYVTGMINPGFGFVAITGK